MYPNGECEFWNIMLYESVIGQEMVVYFDELLGKLGTGKQKGENIMAI